MRAPAGGEIVKTGDLVLRPPVFAAYIFTDVLDVAKNILIIIGIPLIIKILRGKRDVYEKGFFDLTRVCNYF